MESFIEDQMISRLVSEGLINKHQHGLISITVYTQSGHSDDQPWWRRCLVNFRYTTDAARSGCKYWIVWDTIRSSNISFVVVRPPSASVSAFISELADILDGVVTFSDQLFVVGDINSHLELDALNARGLVYHVTPPTHDCGGTIGIVVTRSDLPAPSIDVTNVGLSDHRLLQWRVEFARPSPVYSSVTRRSWRQLDLEVFRVRLQPSLLCNPDVYGHRSTLTIWWSCTTISLPTCLINSYRAGLLPAVVDHRIPGLIRIVAQRNVRQLERAARRADPSAAACARPTAAWYAPRRSYVDLRRQKRESFWLEKVEHERA